MSTETYTADDFWRDMDSISDNPLKYGVDTPFKVTDDNVEVIGELEATGMVTVEHSEDDTSYAVLTEGGREHLAKIRKG